MSSINSDPKRPRRFRLSLDITPKTRRILEKIANQEQISLTATISRALNLYEEVVNKITEGAQPFLQDAGGEKTLLLILI